MARTPTTVVTISIHALLTESDITEGSICFDSSISIHALLTESDDTDWEIVNVPKISIHALLAESDRHLSQLIPLHSYFYPRSPCGERLAEVDGEDTSSGDFYPRSPCGERPTITGIIYSDRKISIHALLAESDDLHRGEMVLTARISIHALLAESDVKGICFNSQIPEFLSTLSLRRATLSYYFRKYLFLISIHALLAESDLIYCHLLRTSYSNFYPRSPCGERLGILQKRCHELLISIHALLAESDKSSYQLQP